MNKLKFFWLQFQERKWQWASYVLLVGSFVGMLVCGVVFVRHPHGSNGHGFLLIVVTLILLSIFCTCLTNLEKLERQSKWKKK